MNPDPEDGGIPVRGIGGLSPPPRVYGAGPHQPEAEAIEGCCGTRPPQHPPEDHCRGSAIVCLHGVERGLAALPPADWVGSLHPAAGERKVRAVLLNTSSRALTVPSGGRSEFGRALAAEAGGGQGPRTSTSRPSVQTPRRGGRRMPAQPMSSSLRAGADARSILYRILARWCTAPPACRAPP